MTGGSITLRPATRDDAALILILEEAGMRPYAEALWGVWTPSATPDTLDLSNHDMIEVAGQDVGCVATAWHTDHLRLRKLYIGPDSRRQGIGASTLARVFQAAAAQGMPLRLSVLTSNRDAARFYLRDGFEAISHDAERIMFERPPSRTQASA
ncbi:Acetyltransferase (GNAT) family protein [Rhodobacteraceae bacterium THAF1]|uniref:GNAT family N-acetyltransferase n=1 Tax=Palleronia sp. THAF1 TaxID=2587842 RepID=UPI000F3C27F2|nr:GNAT family N-acetyltransferase [Palleronia sp. THAF1]QFU09563.1 Acetyltransferase (GNAT) family protein [Palleronia sp. THAF1]VDC20072.1 Acetyltransferase (GNAT) family protein [Rhodobacteraceae bacterium THAF1]